MANERLEGGLVNFFSFVDVDRAACARTLVALELARIVYQVLTKQEAFNGRFKNRPLSRTKHLQWPGRASPPA